MGKHESFEPYKKNIRALEENKERESVEFHTRNLHDEMPQERIDEATGKTLTPERGDSTADAILSKREVDKNDKSEDIMGSLPEEDDEAAKWLREFSSKPKEDKDDFKKAA